MAQIHQLSEEGTRGSFITNIRAYFSVKALHLEYASQVWSPHLLKKILEGVQKFAMKYKIGILCIMRHYDNLLLMDLKLLLFLMACVNFLTFPYTNVCSENNSVAVPLAHSMQLLFFIHCLYGTVYTTLYCLCNNSSLLYKRRLMLYLYM